MRTNMHMKVTITNMASTATTRHTRTTTPDMVITIITMTT